METRFLKTVLQGVMSQPPWAALGTSHSQDVHKLLAKGDSIHLESGLTSGIKFCWRFPFRKTCLETHQAKFSALSRIPLTDGLKKCHSWLTHVAWCRRVETTEALEGGILERGRRKTRDEVLWESKQWGYQLPEL